MSLLDVVIAPASLRAAWQRVRANGGGPGADGITLERFAAGLDARLSALRAQVRDGRYVTQPLLEVALERPGRAPRLLGIPAVRDRVLQTAVAQVLTPVLDPHFEDASFGYRPNRSVAQAVERVIAGRGAGYVWVVDADIQAYFDNIPHDLLMARLRPHLADPSLDGLILQWLKAPVRTASGMRRRERGVPQGSPLSPLLANLFLDPFDEAVLAGGDRWLVRYADDFVILCRTLDEAERTLEDTHRLLTGMGLELNFDKTRITSFDIGFDFLGVRFESGSQWAIEPDAAPWVLPAYLRAPLPAPAGRDGAATPPRPPATPPRTAPAPARPAAGSAPPAVGVEGEGEVPPLLRSLHLIEPGLYLCREGERLIVRRDGEELATIPADKLDQIIMRDEGAVSVGAVRACARKGIALLVVDEPGEPLAALVDLANGRISTRLAQYERVRDEAFRLQTARAIVAAKINNGRVLLRRYVRFRPGLAGRWQALDAELCRLGQALAGAATLDEVRGFEGLAARRYYEGLDLILSPSWRLPGRSRQPPRDPVNAMLSYGYAILFQNLLTLVARRGLDPYLGCLHAVRDGHAALVSDLMEEFRAPVVESVILRLCLQGQVETHDFETGEDGCFIAVEARKRLARALETRLNGRFTHPATGRPLDWRRALLWQVAHFADVIVGKAAGYQPLVMR